MTCFPKRRLAPTLLVLLVLGGPRLAAERDAAAPPDDRAILHVLSRVAFGPRPGDVERVRALGVRAYLEQQLHPERVDDSATDARVAGLTTLSMSSRELASRYVVPALIERRALRASPVGGTATPVKDNAGDAAGRARTPAQARERLALSELPRQKLLRAVYGEHQLEEVLVDYWFNHFNVFAGKGAVRVYVAEYERDAIRPHVFGRFRDMLGATAKSPAMLFYLDNWLNADASATAPARAKRTRGPNENYARELLELHTLGVDGGYTQQDIVEVARAFTGWTIAQPRRGGGFRFVAALHDRGEKTVLGHRIAAGGGIEDGERVLDIVAAHPSTATFIATGLARRFVADDPPPSLVERAAATFRRTGGDLREVMRTIVSSPEFLDPDGLRVKVKTPFEFVVSALRATDAAIDRPLPLVRALRELGMPLYLAQPPTGYADRADAWVGGGSLLARMNFATALAHGRVPGVRVDVSSLAGTASPADATRLAHRLFAGDVSESTRSTLAGAEDAATLVALALGSPEFQKR